MRVMIVRLFVWEGGGEIQHDKTVQSSLGKLTYCIYDGDSSALRGKSLVERATHLQ